MDHTDPPAQAGAADTIPELVIPRRDPLATLVQEDPILRRTRQRGAATIPEGHLPEWRVGVPFLDRPASIHQSRGIPVGILQRVQALIQSAITIRTSWHYGHSTFNKYTYGRKSRMSPLLLKTGPGAWQRIGENLLGY